MTPPSRPSPAAVVPPSGPAPPKPTPPSRGSSWIGWVVIGIISGGAIWIAWLSQVRQSEAAHHHEAVSTVEAQLASLGEKLEKALEEGRQNPILAVARPTPPPAAPARPTAAELLQKLLSLKSGSGFADIRAQRQAVVWLEALTELGPGALTAIREFLLRFEDADYTPDSRRPSEVAENGPGGADRQRRQYWRQLTTGERPLGAGRRGAARLSFGVPPTLRLGLFDVLHAIGGPTAEAILVEQVQQTSRGLEVAYLASTLREMAGDRHRDSILSAVHDLLTSPPPPETGARVDVRAKDYLYAVLDQFQDITFVNRAVQLLVGTDGQLDHHAFDYLGRTLHEAVVPVLLNAWANPALTNVWDRGALASAALPFALTNLPAAQLVRAAIQSPGLPPEVRTHTLRAMAEYPFPSESTEALLNGRLQLVAGLLGELEDPDLLREALGLRQSLQRQLQASGAPATTASANREASPTSVIGSEDDAEDEPETNPSSAQSTSPSVPAESAPPRQQ